MASRGGLIAAVSAAVVAGAAGAGIGWWQSDSGTTGGTLLVLATVPTGPPVYVLPECAATLPEAFQPLPGSPTDQHGPAGRVPAGFTPVRAVRCHSDYLQSGTVTVTRSETSTEADLRTVLAALRPPLISEPVGPTMVCPDIGIVPLAIALVDAHGTAVRVDLPRDQCGLYVDSAIRTLNTVHWTVTGTTQAPLP